MLFRFHLKCNVAYTYCARITQKRETSEKEAIVLGFGATVQQKEDGVGVHSCGFLQMPRIVHCSARICGRFVFPAKASCSYLFKNPDLGTGPSRSSYWKLFQLYF